MIDLLIVYDFLVLVIHKFIVTMCCDIVYELFSFVMGKEHNCKRCNN